jgi:hypothetical protein
MHSQTQETKDDVGRERKVQVNEATGSLLTIDRTLFLTMMKYFVENGLVDRFDEYLEEKGCFELVSDVTFVNAMKRFLVEAGRTDETARMWAAARLDNGLAGGSPMGVRG